MASSDRPSLLRRLDDQTPQLFDIRHDERVPLPLDDTGFRHLAKLSIDRLARGGYARCDIGVGGRRQQYGIADFRLQGVRVDLAVLTLDLQRAKLHVHPPFYSVGT